jgi:hypothetical protein
MRFFVSQCAIVFATARLMYDMHRSLTGPSAEGTPSSLRVGFLTSLVALEGVPRTAA